tara:strand:- start:573 stop:1073 length:501 start_codon:yes stop_codon:yes gene_type:complete
MEISRRNRFSNDVEEKITTQTTWKRIIRITILVLYSLLTVHELVRGIIHTFLYEEGLHDVSGLGTGDILCDHRLSVLMISYGGNNLETFIIRCAILYYYAKYDIGYLIIIWSCVGSMLFHPTTMIVADVGNIDVGDAQLPGKEAMLIRSIVSGVIIILAVAIKVSL